MINKNISVFMSVFGSSCVYDSLWYCVSEREERERLEQEQREEEEREYQERLRKLEEQERKQRARQQEIEERERRKEEERKVPEEKPSKVTCVWIKYLYSISLIQNHSPIYCCIRYKK